MRFALSLGEQACGSILTFAINLWLIRNGAAESYGVYVFWYAVAWVLGTAQGTLVIAHLYGLPSARTHQAQRREPERLLLTVSLALLTLAGIAVTIGNAVLAAAGSPLGAASAVLFIPAFLLFQYVRALAFSRQRTAAAAMLTGSILLAAVAALGADFLLGHPPNAGRVLLITGLCYAGCSLALLTVLLNGAGPMLRIADIRRHAPLLRGSGWLMLGAGSGEVVSRLSSFAVVGRFGAEALAALSAVQVVVRPAWMLSSAWASVGFPQMSARRAEGDRDGLLRVMLTGAAITTLGSAAWTGLVIAAWPWISGELYHGRYAGLGMLGWFWGGNVLLGSMAVALNTAMLALGEYRRLALIDLAGAAVTIAATAALLPAFGYPYAIVATMLGQAAQVLLMAATLQSRLQPRALLA